MHSASAARSPLFTYATLTREALLRRKLYYVPGILATFTYASLTRKLPPYINFLARRHNLINAIEYFQ